MNRSSSNDQQIIQQIPEEDAKSPANNIQSHTENIHLQNDSPVINQKHLQNTSCPRTPIYDAAILQESYQGNQTNQNSIHMAVLEEQYTLAKINRMSIPDTNSQWRQKSQIKQQSQPTNDEDNTANQHQKISSLKTMEILQAHNNINNPSQIEYQNLNGVHDQSSKNQYTNALIQNSQTVICNNNNNHNNNNNSDKKPSISNSISAEYNQNYLISNQTNNNMQSKQCCTLWQIIRLCAAIIFLIQIILQWVNFAIVLQINQSLAWTLLSFNLISIVVGLVYIVYQIKKYDYFLVLFPRKIVGVIFVILSFFNLDFVYAQAYQAFYVQSSDFIKIFNENNLRKKRLALLFQSFSSVIITSLALFQTDQRETTDFESTTWISSIDLTSGFFFVYIFFQVFDLAFHMTFFSTDLFDDTIQFLFNFFDLCCVCFKDDDDEDDDDEDEEASQVKYELQKIDQQSLLFRQIPFTICTFLKFLRDNIFFSLSFYHHFLDLSIRALLFGIAHQVNFFGNYSILLVYELEVLFVAAVIVLVIIIGIINCCFEVSKTYFEKVMLIIVSCLQGIVIKVSRWNIARIFEGMTNRQLFILKFVPGLIRLCEITSIAYILFIKSDQSLHTYLIENASFVKVYIHYVGFLYAIFLAFELIYDVVLLIFIYPKQNLSDENQSDSPCSDNEIQLQNVKYQSQIQAKQDEECNQNNIYPNQQCVLQNQQNEDHNNQQFDHIQRQLSYNKQNKIQQIINQRRKESSESDAIKSFNDEPNPKQVYQTVNHLSKFQSNEYDANNKSNQNSFNNPNHLIQSNNSLSQQSSIRFMDSICKIQEARSMKKLNHEHYNNNRNKSYFNTHQRPSNNSDIENISNCINQDSEIAQLKRQQSEKQNFINESNNLPHQIQQLVFSQNSLINQVQEVTENQKNDTVPKGSQDCLNFIKESANGSLQNLSQRHRNNIIAQRMMQSEKKMQEDGVGDSFASSKFVKIQVQTTIKAQINKTRTAVDLTRGSKENITPLKSPDKLEALSFNGSPTKLTSIPTRKVTDVINKYSNKTQQRRKRSSNNNNNGSSSVQAQDKSVTLKGKRKSNIIPRPTINQLVDMINSNNATNNNNNINNI
ncbi:transmembrane protein, putative (macronuclear) [Tetrahymena thermophila SB210]|uniref:Transmembrane protein, putative n=1 Tax=Tetrahymena thermophila (strain SB210) TaxID=312017 RepID=Q23YA7_TETTS|nr:transmembrane protein, putative [Tetrahymena thermophila SB210]EAS01557.2 transmembrane protein, putative [Tetrahymena thermophila SB210]|eukprot:XP_001021802.2 transmembrane protein, putative [Tetrahymena thermophila SB210]